MTSLAARKSSMRIKARGIVVPTMDAIECIIVEEWDKPQDYKKTAHRKRMVEEAGTAASGRCADQRAGNNAAIYGRHVLGGTRPLILEDLADTSYHLAPVRIGRFWAKDV
jgi:hypothetical protein